METLGTVLIVAQGGPQWTAAAGVLADEYDYRVLTARCPEDAADALSDAHVDIVLAEHGAGGDGLEFLANLRISHPDVIRVLALDATTVLTKQAISPAAIYQFVRKPLDAKQIGLVVERGLESRELARRHRMLSREFKFPADSMHIHARHGMPLHAESRRFEKLVYVSEKLTELCDLARKAARTELPILIQGETGTGKELLARAIHYNSTRHASPLMVQNCGGMSDELLQSELFGHKRGAFTGAISDRLGLFRAGDGGTVFLDEISDVSASFQVSLLRFLQEGEVKPLGSDKTETSNVRIIAASNRPLRALVAAGKFRQDLYFRLKGFELEVPPLRDRPDDVPALAEFFAAKHSSAIGRKILGISAGALEKFVGFDFPGNVRELENEIRRMVALAEDGEYLTTKHMSPAILAAPPPQRAGRTGYIAQGKTLKDKVESLEKQVLNEALTRHRWNQSRAANELGLSRVGLANKIKRYALDQPH
ncbi:sigma-54 dependent transcriptional regulator [Bradyrhizobium sp.]|uniref:sigma-54 dependent transcriptional regulator n=1 Tax=Bradyrhizobium sp. TaxID=376 RepID=UPI003C15DB87